MTTRICKNSASRELVARATARIVIGMSHPRSSSRSSKRTSGYVSQRTVNERRAGYTLIEMMIVVAITGVLAAIAIPAFRGWINRSRSSEAAAFLGVIKLRQAAYRGEFGQYAGFGSDVGGMNGAFVPHNATRMRGGAQYPFPPVGPPGALTPPSPFWAIGASPDGPVRFGYGIVAGTPLQATGGGTGTNLPTVYGLPASELDFYFIAQATTDLDDNGTAMIVECTSFARDIWSSANAKGWE